MLEVSESKDESSSSGLSPGENAMDVVRRDKIYFCFGGIA